jgi:hypothetical protein
MSMMVLILLEFSPTPFAKRFISPQLKLPNKVPTDPKISPIIHFDSHWSSGRDSMMSSMLLMTLAILVVADSMKVVLTYISLTYISLDLLIPFSCVPNL